MLDKPKLNYTLQSDILYTQEIFEILKYLYYVSFDIFIN